MTGFDHPGPGNTGFSYYRSNCRTLDFARAILASLYVQLGDRSDQRFLMRLLHGPTLRDVSMALLPTSRFINGATVLGITKGSWRRQHGHSAPVGSTPARPLCLLRACLAALGSSALPKRAPGHWAPKPPPRGLERAASKVAGSTAFDLQAAAVRLCPREGEGLSERAVDGRPRLMDRLARGQAGHAREARGLAYGANQCVR